MQKVSAQKLLEYGAHYGHQTRRWNPKMGEYLYGSEQGVHVFDLIKTGELLTEALEELKNASSQGKSILLVGTKKQVKDKVREVAIRAECFYVSERWLGGILTNFNQIQNSLKTLQELKDKKAAGSFSKYTKKERLLIDRKIERIERFFSGMVGLNKLPDYMVIIDVKKESGAVIEAKRTGVKLIAVVDSNSDPTDIDFVIPMNDDATKALNYILDLIGDAITEGKKKFDKTTSQKKELK